MLSCRDKLVELLCVKRCVVFTKERRLEMEQFCLIHLVFIPSLFGVPQKSIAEAKHPLMNYLKHLR